jgi:hypothetical protein
MKMMEGNRAVLIVVCIMVAFNGILLSGNGLFMLIAPLVWYDFVPGVTDTGSFNPPHSLYKDSKSLISGGFPEIRANCIFRP